MAVVYKSYVLSSAKTSLSEQGYSFDLQLEVSGFQESGFDRIFEATVASGISGQPSVPALGTTYSTLSANPSGLPSAALSSVASNIEVVETDCGNTMALIVSFAPIERSISSLPALPVPDQVNANGQTSLQVNPRNHDRDGNEIKMRYVPAGEVFDANKHEELITLDVFRPKRVRNFSFVYSGDPETLADAAIGKCDPGGGQGTATYHQWIGFSMSYVLRNDGQWNVDFQTAYEEFGWDPYKVKTLQNGKIPGEINLNNVVQADDIPVAPGDENGAVRPVSYDDWDLTDFPSGIQDSF